jgi:putative SOS response-associated peptidase YedK
MCGRVIQSSGPLRYGIVEGMDMRDSRVHNYPPRWNGAPSQELLVIGGNHDTGKISLDPLRWGLIPCWCKDPKGGRKPINAKSETVDKLPMLRDAYQRRRCILPVDGFFEWEAMMIPQSSNRSHWPHPRHDRQRVGSTAKDRTGVGDPRLRRRSDVTPSLWRRYFAGTTSLTGAVSGLVSSAS